MDLDEKSQVYVGGIYKGVQFNADHRSGRLTLLLSSYG